MNAAHVFALSLMGCGFVAVGLGISVGSPKVTVVGVIGVGVAFVALLLASGVGG